MYDAKIDEEYQDIALKIIKRAKWGALPPKFTEPLPLPAMRLMFTQTQTERCMNKEDCIQAMRTMQKYYMEERDMPDLPYSFCIGGDLRIYEGRGWGVRIRRRDLEDWVDDRIVIGYFGKDGVEDSRLDKIIKRGYDLMYFGIANDYIVNFDEYDCQDEEARKNEVRELERSYDEEAKKEVMKELEKEKNKKKARKKDKKEWEEHINTLHYEGATGQDFDGDKELFEAIKQDNLNTFKVYDDQTKIRKKDWKDDSSDMDTSLIISSDEHTSEEPL